VPVRSLMGRRRAPVILVLGALLAGALSGCSGEAGAAAVVDGHKITVAELQATAKDLAPYLKDVSQANVLLVLIVAPTFDKAAAQEGVGVSDQQARDLLASQAPKGSGKAAAPTEFSPGAIEVARFTLVQQQLQGLPNAAAVAKRVTKQLAALHPEVNPRYGKIDLTTGKLTSPSYPWLVTKAAAG